MIKISTLTHKEFYLNCELFEKIEANPDTVITMTNGNKYVVEDTPEEVIKKIKDYKKEILQRF
ncbi:flagellar FlbD family protein [Clostridium cylindrosporum]|uniref:Motility protein n=1 Tax=Clostridium cylindrosporum DSM 605 TaxID=1121307 RepID=A0A0J8DBP0_CLOCY|nr:flagellar FlbD family protein [Clostridium cylindrosporum]KMT21708.1 motility protein [Clostridium cylindrosporum DSM 605]